MSHSQFHSINLFILRHAWLNLWDKHMTTGRINQVTTFRSTFVAIIYLCVTSTHFRDEEFVISFMCWRSIAAQGYFFSPDMREHKPPWTHKWHHLVSQFLHVSSKIPLSNEKDKGHPPLMGTTNDRWYLKGAHGRGGSPSGYLHQVWPSASNPPPFDIAQTYHTTIAWGFKGK